MAGVLAFWLAACGGSGGSTDTGATGSSSGNGGIHKVVSKAEYARKAEAICKKIPATFQQLVGQLSSTQQSEPREVVAKAVLPTLREAVTSLSQLGAPEGDPQKAAEIVEALETAVEKLEKNPDDGLSGPESPFAEFNRLTQAYGLKACSYL